MQTIRPITDLKKHAEEIFKTCLQDEQPVFLTKNGHGKRVIMSEGYFDKMQAMMRLYAKSGLQTLTSLDFVGLLSHLQFHLPPNRLLNCILTLARVHSY